MNARLNIQRALMIATVAATGFLLAGIGTATAAPQGSWTLPINDVSATGEDADLPQVGTAPDGRVTVAWKLKQGSDSIIQATTRPPGGTFGAPVDLSAFGGEVEHPRIAVGPDGTVIVVWRRNGDPTSDPMDWTIQAAVRKPGALFTAPVNLSDPGGGSNRPRIAIGPDGTATAIWHRRDSSTSKWVVQTATRFFDNFAPPVDIGFDNAQNAKIAFGPDGTATAFWSAYSGSPWGVQVATRPPGGAFSDPVDLADTEQAVGAAKLAVGPDGTTTVAWSRYDGTTWWSQAATRPPGGSFGTPVDITAPGTVSKMFTGLAAGPDGAATMVWRHDNGSNNIIQSTTRPPGGSSFGPVIDLSEFGQNASRPQVVTGRDGTTTMSWNRSNGSKNIIQAVTRTSDGGFGAPVDLSAPGQSSDKSRLAVAADGSVSAVWVRSDGANWIVQETSTARPAALLVVANRGPGGGTVTSAPAGVNCGSLCARNFPSYTRVTLTATPDPGSSLVGWGGACRNATGNTCNVRLVNRKNVIAKFRIGANAKLKIMRFRPKHPQVRRGRKVSIKVIIKNIGNGPVTKTRLCVAPNANVRKALRPVGKRCKKMGAFAPGKAKAWVFRLKATARARRGRSYRVMFKLFGRGTSNSRRAVRVRVR